MSRCPPISLARLGACVVLLAAMLYLSACKRDDMADQPRIKPFRPSSFFADGTSARTPPQGTVSIHAPLEEEPHSWSAPSMATAFPFPITRNDLLRGQQEFTIYCTPCHGILGDGDGMVPQRGFTRPPSYHTDRLRAATPTYFYNVMTMGIGAMYSYGERVDSDDRWRIAAYIRALQWMDHPPTTTPAPATTTSSTTEQAGGREGAP